MKKKNVELLSEGSTEAVAPQCCVVLEEVGTQKIPVIKTVMDVTGLRLREAKALVDAVDSVPQIIIGKVSATKANEIRSRFEGIDAQANVISESDDPGAAKALKLAIRRRAAAEKKAAKKEAQCNVVLDLFRDKVKSEFLGIEAFLDVEIQKFREKLRDSGIDVSLLPEPKVTISGNEEQAVMAVSVIF